MKGYPIMAAVIPPGPPSPKMLRGYLRVLADLGPDSGRAQSIRDREPDFETLFDILDDIADGIAPGPKKLPALLEFARALGYEV